VAAVPVASQSRKKTVFKKKICTLFVVHQILETGLKTSANFNRNIAIFPELGGPHKNYIALH
jgi:hypothetical protein